MNESGPLTAAQLTTPAKRPLDGSRPSRAAGANSAGLTTAELAWRIRLGASTHYRLSARALAEWLADLEDRGTVAQVANRWHLTPEGQGEFGALACGRGYEADA
jgi:hypothetical protein